MARIPKYYWDACVWIELISRSSNNRFKRCEHVISEVQQDRAELWTSAFTLAEVYKRKCNGNYVSLLEDRDDEFESFFKSGIVKPILVNVQVAKVSRRLCRKYQCLRKPQDAIHVASCIIGNMDELHTFDAKDLIKLDGKITVQNGNTLKISHPPFPSQGELFDGESSP